MTLIPIIALGMLVFWLVKGLVFICTDNKETEQEIKQEEESRKMHFTTDENMHWELHCNSKTDNGDKVIESAPCFTAEQAILFYNTAPNKWWHSCYSIYYQPTGCYDKETTQITFPNKEEYVKFMRFLDNQDKIAKQRKQIQNTLDILPYLQEDAKRAQEAADQEMANCEEKVKDIYKRLRKEQTRSI